MFDNTNFPWVENMSFDTSTIGHMIRAAGYYSTYQGKWHLHRIAAEPDHTIYTKRWPLSLAPKPQGTLEHAGASWSAP